MIFLSPINTRFMACLQYFDQVIQPLNNCHYLLVENNNHHIYMIYHVFFFLTQFPFHDFKDVYGFLFYYYFSLPHIFFWILKLFVTFSQDMPIFSSLDLRLSLDSMSSLISSLLSTHYANISNFLKWNPNHQ